MGWYYGEKYGDLIIEDKLSRFRLKLIQLIYILFKKRKLDKYWERYQIFVKNFLISHRTLGGK